MLWEKVRQLAARLDSEIDDAQPLCCQGCGRYLGCVGNGAGIAFGRYEARGDGSAELVDFCRIRERRTSLECLCGHVTRWRQSR